MAAPALPPANTATQSIQAMFSNYLANTAFWTLYKGKVLSGVVTPAMLPSSVPLKLNTTFFKTCVVSFRPGRACCSRMLPCSCSFLPALYKAFPNRGFDLVVRHRRVCLGVWLSCGAAVLQCGCP